MQTLSKSSPHSKRIAPQAMTSSQTTPVDVIEMFREDHKKMHKLFKKFEKLSKKNDINGKVEIALLICNELAIHIKLKEEIFYPAAREAIQDDALLNKAAIDHALARKLISDINQITGTHPMYDAKVNGLMEYIEHHVKEEEKEIFPEARKAKMDLNFFGIIMADRKEALKAKPN